MTDFEHTPLPLQPTLSKEQKDLIFGSAPLLAPQKYGLKITTEMYKNMLDENQALKNVFNLSKQASLGQQFALSKALEAYALNIHDLSPILPVVISIANKHASLSIAPWMYNVVGHYLIGAIVTVLAKDNILFEGALMAAWVDAYWYLAHVFIGLEADLYKTAGWSGWKEFKVMKRVPETPDITSFYLKPVDGTSLKAFKPGQYISVQLTVDELGCKQSRQYSLSESFDPAYLRISVRRDPGAKVLTASGAADPSTNPATHPAFVSNLLHSKALEGSTVEVASPFGEFILDDSTFPLVLISGGVGVTPVLSMLNTVTSAGAPTREVTWIQSVRTLQDHAFRNHIDELVAKYPNKIATATYYTSLSEKAPELDSIRAEALSAAPSADRQLFGGHIALSSDVGRFDAKVLHLGDGDAQYYICGPAAFMDVVEVQLQSLGVDAKRIHTEKFAGDKPSF
ncbi:globin-like protein [Clavulina sp. PMI_390]|nr:globin-like protein [Clavulina sp. PMI_390]